MITVEMAKNILIFLSRTDLKGAEVEPFQQCYNALVKIVKESENNEKASSDSKKDKPTDQK